MLEKRFIANKNYILREIAGEAVLVSVGTEIVDFCGVVNLNSSARILWERLQEGATKEELIQLLKDKFRVTEEKVLEDVDTTIQLLLERGLITDV